MVLATNRLRLRRDSCFDPKSSLPHGLLQLVRNGGKTAMKVGATAVPRPLGFPCLQAFSCRVAGHLVLMACSSVPAMAAFVSAGQRGQQARRV